MPQPLTYGLEEVSLAVRHILDTCGFPPPGGRGDLPARTFALTGELGAGKTTLVAALVRALGVTEPTSSPTFSLVNEYAAPDGPVYHLDCYRLEDVGEALDAGLEDVFGSGRPIFVEWPAVIEPLLPEDVVILRLQHGPDGETRLLTIITDHLNEQ